MRRAVSLLREAAQELAATEDELLIPEEEPGEPYPLGLHEGRYPMPEVAEALQLLADLLEQ